MSAMLQTQQLSITVPDTLNGEARTLCRAAELAFRLGENWAILGPNGSGKTSLLHTLAGLRPPSQGKVLYDGRSLDWYPAKQRARRIGVLLQQTEELFPSTVLQTVLCGRHPYLADTLWQELWQWESEQDIEQARQALAAVGLSDFAERDLTTLSGGERRRVEIATLLTQDPPFCLLDEPTNHLDLNYQMQVMQLLARRTADKRHSNIFVLHDINLALHFCQQGILLFGNGEYRAGPLRSIVDREVLGRLYGCAFKLIQDGENSVYLPVKAAK